ncbi:LysR substrate-binding domain-containing protein [Sphingobium boeckii]|uniref:DNA-binding transcriptional LysR family regulator n=1 Tax=Sphingobium boeckii TaxID=1082345 RepID=A0A7W9EET0_9SPHN|nr:LysR substrate-binding domain-containing protein [Sphingobium boeckii]MBB5686344.1 DNA-binding transcriptional LysR family regulator [Sphingobium boeckii]
MELRHLRYFVAVAEELHFSRAAKRLNMSQPPLSQQIAALESELGLKLLDRDKRNVSLSKAGDIFLNRARMILASADEAIDEARRVDRGYEGKIVVGFMSAVMLVRLSEFLTEFHALSPTAEVDLRQMQSNAQYMAVINGEVDVGFVDIAVGSMGNVFEATELNVTLALHERLVLCVGATHALADRKSIAMRELADIAFITLTRQTFPSFFDTFLHLCQKSGYNPHIAQQVESMPVAVALAGAGFGVAVVPALSISGVHAENTRFIEIEDEAFVDIYLISRSANRTGLVQRLREICEGRVTAISD